MREGWLEVLLDTGVVTGVVNWLEGRYGYIASDWEDRSGEVGGRVGRVCGVGVLDDRAGVGVGQTLARLELVM